MCLYAGAAAASSSAAAADGGGGWDDGGKQAYLSFLRNLAMTLSPL